MKNIIMYSMSGCRDCAEIKDELRRNEIVFIERDITKFTDEWNEVVEDCGQNIVPMFIVNDGDVFNYLLPGKNFNSVREAIEIIKKG